MGKRNNLNEVLKYTQCVDIWLFNKGEFKILKEYDSFIKVIIKNGSNELKTLSEWLSETNIELFMEYNKCIESLV